MSYPLLQLAPEDHNSKAFIFFLVANNKVLINTDDWLIIENCKYHFPDREWWTAFYIGSGRKPSREALGYLFYLVPYDWNMMLKDPQKRSVSRYHVHIYQN